MGESESKLPQPPLANAASTQQASGQSFTKSLEWFKAIAMPLVTLLVGGAITYAVNSRQQQDIQIRFYAEMMGRREAADTELRKDMFTSVLNTFFEKDPKLTADEKLDQQVLNLELLAYNFHDSIDLGPLFKDVRRRIPDGTAEAIAELRRRLEKVAREVNERELKVLADSGTMVREGVDAEQLANVTTTAAYVGPALNVANGQSSLPRQCLQMKGNAQWGRQFRLEVIDYDRRTREMQMRLYVSRPLPVADCRRASIDLVENREIDIHFWVSLFAFPMIDNTRLSGNERCAVVMTQLTEDVAQFVLVYFPGSRASLKDKPYYDELLETAAPPAARRW